MPTLADVRGDRTEIDGTYGHAAIEWKENWGGAMCTPVIIWDEGMRFHMQRLREHEAFDMGDGFTNSVQKALKELLTDDFICDVQWSDWDDDIEENENGEEVSYPYLHIEVWPVLDSEWDDDFDSVFGLLWPAIATLFNVTDPGTWNCPYLFSGLASVSD